MKVRSKLPATHLERDSVFFKLMSKRRLAEVLFTSSSNLRELTGSKDRYSEFQKPKASGGFREIEAPDGDLKRIQTRIADLLARIAPPEFLFAPVRGRSYVDNAARHRGSRQFHKLDIADFYPSCTASRVAWFFRTRMGCSPDVTAMLVRLTTRNGHLPQGSPCSPILAYFAYVDMWHLINERASEVDARASIYVDDIEISGVKFCGNTIWDIKAIVTKFGFRLRDDKEAKSFNRPVLITGVVVHGEKVLLPNSQHKKMRLLKLERSATRDVERLKSINRQLAGRHSQYHQVIRANAF